MITPVSDFNRFFAVAHDGFLRGYIVFLYGGGQRFRNVDALKKFRRGLKFPGKLLSMLPFLPLKAMGYTMTAAAKAGGGYISPMSGGGRAGAGTPYLVGEQGPELFVPSQGGQVLNTATTSSIGSNMQFRNVTIGIDSFGGLS